MSADLVERSRRPTTVALRIVAGCIGAVLVVTACAGTSHRAADRAATSGAGVVASTPAVGPSTPGPPVAGAGTAVSSSVAASPAAASPTGEAGFATGAAHPPHGVPSAVVVPESDGCDRAYGKASQCIPRRAPGGGPVTCDLLARYGYLPLLVTTDHLGLTTSPGASTAVVDGARYLVGCGS